MMYQDKYHPRVKKELKKFNPKLRKEIKEIHIPEILRSPKAGKALLGDLSGIYSYHFKFSGKRYRIAYVIDENMRTIGILMVGKREHFYTILKRRL